MQRIDIQEMNDLIGVKFPVLDDGFVCVIDYMGGDSSITQAARVSYGAGTKSVSDDRHLIRYLMSHRHTSPFEMCELKLMVRVPMDVWRQWIRHRTASVNEYSTRYSEAIDSIKKTDVNQWRIQSSNNKQGSLGFFDERLGLQLTREEAMFHEVARDLYERRLAMGIAREQARKDLPLSTYTEAYWKIDLHNLFHFLELRMDSHAQWEIRQYANVIGYEIVSKWVPTAWRAFEDYNLNAIRFSKQEMGIIKHIIAHNPVIDTSGITSRELVEFNEKVGR